jgi:hypothetical protein
VYYVELGKMFESYIADMCTNKFPLMSPSSTALVSEKKGKQKNREYLSNFGAGAKLRLSEKT